MKKLNNKGFAITGILYTVLILFLLVLLAILGGLRASRTILERSTTHLEKTYNGNNEKSTENVEKTLNTKKAAVTGKYIFELDTGEEKYPLTSYLIKNTPIDHNITFLTSSIKDYTYKFSFETGEAPNIITLKEIYSFEGDEEWKEN